MLPGVTVTSATDAGPSRRSDSRLGHRLEHPDRAAETRTPFYRQFAFWFPVGMYAVSRLYVFVAVIVLAKNQMALPMGLDSIRIAYPTPADPGYLTAMTNWDGQWYRIIAENGYPAVLPTLPSGEVDMSPWAFFPVFPLSVGAIMSLTGLPFVVVAPVLSTVIGFPAMYLLFRLVDRAVGRWEAIVAVTATCFFIASSIFSASYTESTALLLVVSLLLLLRARHYWWVAVALVVLSLTRNVVIVMAPVIVTHAIVRWRQGDEGLRPVRWRWGMAALTGFAAALTFLWPTIVSIATNTPDAYNRTMQAWNIETEIKLGLWWGLLDEYAGVSAQVLGVAGVAAFAWWMLSKHSWRWGPEIWAWAGAYPAYILLVTSPTASRVRYALLAFPMTLIIAWVLRLRWWDRYRYWLLGGILVLGAAQMWWWTQHYLIIETLGDDLYP